MENDRKTAAVREAEERTCADPLLETVFSAAPEATWLVGGYPRDLLLSTKEPPGRRPLDMDFAVEGSPRETALKVREALVERLGERVTMVELEAERTVRLVLKSGEYLDFAAREGEVEQDLLRRDFTANAVAYRPGEGFFDPAGGIGDILEGRLRAISEKNLLDDPLRLLRAFRIEAETGLVIEAGTLGLIASHAPLMEKPARERITAETARLLSAREPESTLRKSLEAGGLLCLILDAGKEELLERLEVLRKLEPLEARLGESLEGQGEELAGWDRPLVGFSLAGFLRLETLLSGGGAGLRERGLLLSLGRRLSGRADRTLSLWRRAREVLVSPAPARPWRELTLFFEEARESAFDLIVILKKEGEYLPWYREFREIRKASPLPAEEIAELAGLERGPELGRAITELRRLVFENVVKSPNEIKAWLTRDADKP